MIPPGRCGTGVPLGQLDPGDAAEIAKFRAWSADVAAQVRDGASRDEAARVAYARHYPPASRHDAPCPDDDCQGTIRIPAGLPAGEYLAPAAPASGESRFLEPPGQPQQERQDLQ